MNLIAHKINIQQVFYLIRARKEEAEKDPGFNEGQYRALEQKRDSSQFTEVKLQNMAANAVLLVPATKGLKNSKKSFLDCHLFMTREMS